jgi:hypothetical protein
MATKNKAEYPLTEKEAFFDAKAIDQQIEKIKQENQYAAGTDPYAKDNAQTNVTVYELPKEQDPNEALTASNEPKAEEPSPLPVVATTPLMPVQKAPQHVQEPEQAINIQDVVIEVFREAIEAARNHGHDTPEQIYLHHFLPALSAKGLHIVAVGTPGELTMLKELEDHFLNPNT